MATDRPSTAVLSEQFQERVNGRRLRAALFLTYRFDPSFFEQQVVPVFLDVPVSHDGAIRLAQLENTLREVSVGVAVYYDANGLESGEGGSAKLDVQRIPMRTPNGVFHPKNVFLLLDDEPSEGTSARTTSLVVASMSANLTRAGWWENVEACYIEEYQEGEWFAAQDEMLALLDRVERNATTTHSQEPLKAVRNFLRQSRASEGAVHSRRPSAHFYSGGRSLASFLEKVAGDSVRGANLEVISPYFDDATRSAPLETLIDRFELAEVRVFLPQSHVGEAECKQELFEAVQALPYTSWAQLPNGGFLNMSRHGDASPRFVHAKLYRFFTAKPRREVYFVGSANLTRAGHSGSANVETGFVIERRPNWEPTFWLEKLDQAPGKFVARTDDETEGAESGSRLSLIYYWDSGQALAHWSSSHDSPQLRLTAGGALVHDLPALPPSHWTELSKAAADNIREFLKERSLFEVHGEVEGISTVLVQEAGMAQKPSLLSRLSPTDILYYWALLSPEQRNALIEAHMLGRNQYSQDNPLVTKLPTNTHSNTLFDRFAGMFHAFASLERSVRNALEVGEGRMAAYRLFGEKFDSLGTLLDLVNNETSRDGIRTGGLDEDPGSAGQVLETVEFDEVDRYVILLSAKQLRDHVAGAFPDFWKAHADEANKLDERLAHANSLRELISTGSKEESSRFLAWFEHWFLTRAEPVREPG